MYSAGHYRRRVSLFYIVRDEGFNFDTSLWSSDVDDDGGAHLLTSTVDGDILEAVLYVPGNLTSAQVTYRRACSRRIYHTQKRKQPTSNGD